MVATSGFAEKTRELTLAERAKIAALVVAMWPHAKKNRHRSLRAALLMFLAEYPGAPTSQMVAEFDGTTSDLKEYNRRVSRMTQLLRSLQTVGLITADKKPGFVPRGRFGSRWRGGAKPGVYVHDHTARWELVIPVEVA